ncbi:MAG: nitronate monooxygenase [Gammaproteobacteria bacterium]|nr:nitronate monooxygenase [Gammaproteobacteria bacterium]
MKKTRAMELLGIELPIVQAPMAGATTPALVGAVCAAGGLGSFGAAATAPERIRAVIHAVRQRTTGSFNMNLFVPDWEPVPDDPARVAAMQAILAPLHAELEAGEVPAPGALFGPFDKQLEVLMEEQVPVVSFHFGAPPGAVAVLKRGGAVVMSSATTVAEAVALEEAGVDIIIAQGAEAGGHRGTFAGDWQQSLIGTLALVPQIVDAVSTPVIAAGGIMDGRGVAAVMALGAGAAQLGTAYLACPENSISPAYRAAVLTANAERSTVTKVFSGKPARGLRNRYLDTLSQHEDTLLPFPSQYSIYRRLRARATELEDSDFLPMWAGQGVGLAKEEAAGALTNRLAADAQAVLDKLRG